MVTYRAALDVPVPTVEQLAAWLAAHRRWMGRRVLGCDRQTVAVAPAGLATTRQSQHLWAAWEMMTGAGLLRGSESKLPFLLATLRDAGPEARGQDSHDRAEAFN